MPEWLRKIFQSDGLPGYYFNQVDFSPTQDGFQKIVPIGDFLNHHNGPHSVTLAHLQQMVFNFQETQKANKDWQLLVDYEHRSLLPLPLKDSRAAGWINALEVRADGLYAKLPDWTNNAKSAIDAREYKYLSPVYLLEDEDKQRNKIGANLVSVAITNTPYFDRELPAVKVNSKQGGEMKLSKESLAKLGLGEDATEEQVNEALLKLQEKPAEAPTEKPAEKPAEKESADPVLNALEKINSRLEALENGKIAETNNAAEMLVNSAIAEGRITPAEKAFYLNSAKGDLASTKAAIEARPKAKALPNKWAPPSPSTSSGNGQKVNSHQAAADYLRCAMAN